VRGLAEQISFDGAGALGFALSAPPIHVSLGSTYTVETGAILTVDSPDGTLWRSPGVTTHDSTVVAPSDPLTTNGFVAVGPGRTALSGATSGGQAGVAVIVVSSPTKIDLPEKKLSTGEIAGIAAAGATAIGTIVYLATRKKKRRRRR
jgi:hypothetical protein